MEQEPAEQRVELSSEDFLQIAAKMLGALSETDLDLTSPRVAIAVAALGDAMLLEGGADPAATSTRSACGMLAQVLLLTMRRANADHSHA